MSERWIRIVAAFFLAACSERADSGPSSALLITLDTTRFDALGSNGAPPGVTPHLDRLASEGVSFERAYAVAPLTLPSHASMLTGLYPPRHSVRTNGHGRLPGAATTLAEAATEAGLDTAAFVSAVVLDETFGLDQGFDLYDSPRHDADRTANFYAERAASETAARALEWLSNRKGERGFFLWVHLWDPHAPLAAPAGFRGTTPSPYLDEVAAMDHAVGGLIGALRENGTLERTVVLVVADHGEAFGEHGELSHGSLCYDTTLRIPMILRYPDGRRGGTRSKTIVSVADVAPTLADALGLRLGDDLDGTSRYPAHPLATRGVYFESYYGYLNYDWSPIAGWIDADGKYVHSSDRALFDLAADPNEERDLSAARADELERYRAAIDDVASRPALAPEGERGVEADLRASLQKLGYADVEAPVEPLPHPLAPSTRPSPMARAHEGEQIVLALALLNESRYAESEALYAEILRDNPRNFEALERIAFCQLRQLRFDDAIASYERALSAGRATANAITYLGVCKRATGKIDEAIELYSRAIRTDPRETEALWQMIDALESLDRGDEAMAYRSRLRELTE